MKEIKITATELDVYADGITKIAAVAGDVIAVSEELAASMIGAGQAVYNEAAAEVVTEPTTKPKEKSIEQMTKSELKAYAATQGIELDEAQTKVEMLAAYNEALAK